MAGKKNISSKRRSDIMFSSALVVAEDLRHARIDRDFFRNAGIIDVRLGESGSHGLEILDDFESEIVLCDMHLGDMKGTEFIRRVSERRQGHKPPLLSAGVEARESHVLDAVAAGCSGFLVRPYSMDVFLKQLKSAERLTKASATRTGLVEKAAAVECEDASLESLERIAQAKNKARQLFMKGCTLLADRSFDAAIAAFSKALNVQNMFAEAYVGLAKAWKGKGNTEKYRYFMLKAAESYARMDKFQAIRRLFVDVLKTVPKGANPFLELAFRLVGSGEYGVAARAYAQAEELTPGRVDIYASMARACHFTEDPTESAAFLSDAVAELPDMPCAASIFDRIMHTVADAALSGECERLRNVSDEADMAEKRKRSRPRRAA